VRESLAAAAALALVAGAAVPGCDGRRVRHLAVPVLVDPSSRAAPAPALELAGVECRIEELGRAGGRITALLPSPGGALWVGTFDGGVVRMGGELPPAARALAGRQRMVNALTVDGGTVWAATQGGLVGLEGTRAGQVLLGDEAVSALAEAGGVTYAGTGHGLFRVGGDCAAPVPVESPDGEPLRVNALAAPQGSAPDAARLWIGTAAGAYSVPLASLASPEPRAAWHPLVFGDPPASTNVVTALAALGDAAVAGTDDGGLVRIGPGGQVSATHLADALANQVNPGAASAAGPLIAFGTQGGGLLLARARGAKLEILRPSGLEGAAVSAVRADGGRWLVGTSDGRVLRIACPVL
jgi:ligand-binding sensor domain-containing protein